MAHRTALVLSRGSITPGGIAVDSDDNLYVTDTFNHTIRKITPAGDVTTVAGTAGVVGSSDGTGTTAEFNHPVGVVVDPSGNLYVADTSNSIIRKITPAGVVTTIAGTVGVIGSVDGPGTAAKLAHPQDITVDFAGNLYITDAGNKTIRKITFSTIPTDETKDPEGIVGGQGGDISALDSGAGQQVSMLPILFTGGAIPLSVILLAKPWSYTRRVSSE